MIEDIRNGNENNDDFDCLGNVCVQGMVRLFDVDDILGFFG